MRVGNHLFQLTLTLSRLSSSFNDLEADPILVKFTWGYVLTRLFYYGFRTNRLWKSNRTNLPNVCKTNIGCCNLQVGLQCWINPSGQGVSSEDKTEMAMHNTKMKTLMWSNLSVWDQFNKIVLSEHLEYFSKHHICRTGFRYLMYQQTRSESLR
jgi:hypothetical protein